MSENTPFVLEDSVLGSDITRLESLLDQLLDQALSEGRGDLAQRWNAVEAMYRMDPGSSGAPIFPDWEVRPTPLMTGRVDRLTNSVWAGLTATYPYCQAIPDVKDQSGADLLEAGVQKAAERAGVDEAMRHALRDAALCGVGLIWCLPSSEGVKVSAIHPRRFAMLPTFAPTLQEASFCGHALYLPRWQLRDLAAAKGWRDLPPLSEDQPDYGPRESASGLGGPDDWAPIEVWHLLVRLQIGERKGWWSAAYARQSRTVLFVEPYDLEVPWYAEVRLHSEGGPWWPSGSVASRLQGLQHAHTQLCAIREQGTMFSAFGLMVGPEGLKAQVTQFRPGQLLKGSPGFPVQAIFPPFNPSISLELIAQIEQQADTAIGISRLGTGQQLSNASATEAAFLRAVTEQAENSYASVAAKGLEQVFDLLHRQFAAHSFGLRSAYGQTMDDTFWSSVHLPVRWRSSGRSIDNAPSVQMDRLQAALALSRQPGSVLDPQKTEKAVLQALQLPVQLELLLKGGDE
jgi:hypothetical protein